MLSMRETVLKEVEKIKEEWEKEINKLEPLGIPSNTLNNSLNAKRNEISNKYIKQIREVIAKHPRI